MSKIPKSGNILVVDDDEDVLFAARLFLKNHFALVQTESNPEKIPALLKGESFDVVLLDMNFTADVTSGQEGFHWLNRILQISPAASVILVTAYADYDMAVRAIKEGAADFIVKPWKNEKLLTTVSSALTLSRFRHEAHDLRERQKQLSDDLDQPYQDFIGDSPAMQRVFTMIAKVARTDANVLITGENGTGKELVARAVHRGSSRADEAFIRVDMGSLSGTLFESELFGHVKGAFTDARENRPGRFELASGGTLFLDEISNLPLDLQAKILSALQNRRVTRVGSNTSRQIDIRLICATNRYLAELVEGGEFRQDLLYRINTVEIALPPLRERGGDMVLLADHFLAVYAKKYRKPITRVSAPTLKKLERYHWPGNVRELQHAVERAVIMSDSSTLQPDDFLFSVTSPDRGEPALDNYNLEEVEKAVIRKVLARCGGNISLTARQLGLSRAALYRRLERYGL
ncbi:MAG: sigma-54-dependent Fis family transcriptional regulator [Candidatus Krumholzibacteriota bacterium]|nr:sigma-54-dependent Fis family transcriptional regulator [Candidatus Krumholzibacteriota bacterium]